MFPNRTKEDKQKYFLNIFIQAALGCQLKHFPNVCVWNTV